MLRDLIEDAQKERRRRATKGPRNLALGTVIGTAIGTALGVLFAPKSGKETRQDIAEKANESYEKANDAVKDTVDTVRLKADYMTDSVKDKYEEVADNVKGKYEEVTETVKDKYQEYTDRNMIEISTEDDPNYEEDEPIVKINMPIDTEDMHKDDGVEFLDTDVAEENIPKDESEEKSADLPKEDKDNKNKEDKSQNKKTK